MSDQPKTTGEWTAEYLDSFWKDCDFMTAIRKLLKAINAALAADRKKAISVIHERTMEVARLDEQLSEAVEALKVASEDLTCSSLNETHYCPNCDNSLSSAKTKIDAALAKIRGK